jgi:hypothetical protein
VAAGDFVTANQPIATNYSILGAQQNVLLSPADGIVLGIATLPAVKPGEPIVHIALPDKPNKRMREFFSNAPASDPHSLAQRDLATSIDLIKPESDPK